MTAIDRVREALQQHGWDSHNEETDWVSSRLNLVAPAIGETMHPTERRTIITAYPPRHLDMDSLRFTFGPTGAVRRVEILGRYSNCDTTLARALALIGRGQS